MVKLSEKFCIVNAQVNFFNAAHFDFFDKISHSGGEKVIGSLISFGSGKGFL